LFTGAGSRLSLPVRTPHPGDEALPEFGPAESAAPLPVEILRTDSRQQFIRRDVISGMTELRTVIDDGRLRFSQTGMETDDTGVENFTLCDDDPLAAPSQVERRLEYRRGEWQICLETRSKLTADATHFYVTNQLEAYEGRSRVFARSWSHQIPRDMV